MRLLALLTVLGLAGCETDDYGQAREPKVPWVATGQEASATGMVNRARVMIAWDCEEHCNTACADFCASMDGGGDTSGMDTSGAATCEGCAEAGNPYCVDACAAWEEVHTGGGGGGGGGMDSGDGGGSGGGY